MYYSLLTSHDFYTSELKQFTISNLQIGNHLKWWQASRKNDNKIIEARHLNPLGKPVMKFRIRKPKLNLTNKKILL